MKVLCTRGLPLGFLVWWVQGCVPRNPEDGGSAREPVRWILVERRYGDLYHDHADAAGEGGGQSDGKINPEALVLAFHPLYPEDLTWEVVVNPEDHFVELVDLSPEGPVAPGEIVTARFRVGRARPGERYWLSALPSEKGVEILGQASLLVRGQEAARFRFTSELPGSAGIRVAVERVTESGQDPVLQPR